ncbi:GIY-YIG nuclease family protein [Candidatus Bathyarchaeota archaeon]|nr:GIY-YIG nuclease family protein [Candidatus Bathyarchaeota archaeon]
MSNTQKRRRSYYVYLLLCEDGSYYTGYTNDVISRLGRHRKGHGARYTKMRRPKRIAHVEQFRTRQAAMRREREIKTLTHDQKTDLARRKTRMKREITRK